MTAQIKKFTLGVVTVVFLSVCALPLLFDDPEHIEDTNGAEDHSLTVITDEDIIQNRMGCVNFKLAVINNGRIIRVIELGPIQGYLSLVVAGESADFVFRIFRHDYNAYSHAA